MNIKRAKQEIKDSIQAYLLKDEYGEYEIPAIRQRPILLMGPPGIGKTQIMEQIAVECQVGLVAYTITHHTRQSAIGLPYISQKEYGGSAWAVTEYTMSEIVASIYEEMEKTGLSEGILFIDEINCVSETLAPAMLQFLQCKTFGNHAIPQGWIIVAAGNPPEYNQSVREFDLVTLDRVKKIDVTADFSVWKEYAYQAGIHPAVISYLNIRKQYFYLMETTVDGKLFATPRGWEDLSRLLQVYEKLDKSMDWEVVIQYIQHPKVAKDFANYLELYRKYQTDYQIEAVLEGVIDPVLAKKAAHASFDERLSVVGLLLSRLTEDCKKYFYQEEVLTQTFQVLKAYQAEPGGIGKLERQIGRLQALRQEKKQAGLLSVEMDRVMRGAVDMLQGYLQKLRLRDGEDGESLFAYLKELFGEDRGRLDGIYDVAASHLEHILDFLEGVFGEGQELVIFITELNGNYYSVRFLKQYDCERYYLYNERLLFGKQRQSILKRMDELSL